MKSHIIFIHLAERYVLYNYVKRTIISYASVVEQDGYVVIYNVASEKGFGGIIHDVVMMNNFPKEIRSDDELSQSSIEIWKYYLNNRYDVLKNLIPSYLTSDVENYNEEALLYGYRLTPNEWFDKLKNRSKKIINKYQLNTLDILANGEYFFNEKYGEYFA